MSLESANREHAQPRIMERLERGVRVAALDDRPVIYDPAEIARAGVFVSIDGEAKLKIERGFVRPEDEAPITAEPDGDDTDQPVVGGPEGGVQRTTIFVSEIVEIDGADVVTLFRRDGASRKPAQVRRFRRSKKADWEWIARPVDGVAVTAADVIILRAEFERCERA